MITGRVVIATLLWADLHNRYVWVVLAVMLGASALIGFYDDYRKLVLRDSRGLPSRWKYFWQSVFGLAAALFLFHTARTCRRRNRVVRAAVQARGDAAGCWFRGDRVFHGSSASPTR